MTDEHPTKRSRRVSRRVRNTLVAFSWAWPLFALLLPVLFVIQYEFVRYQVSRATEDDLRQWASDIRAELRFTDRWQLKAFRNADLNVPNWFVMSREGELIDTTGFVRGLMGTVRAPLPGEYERLVNVRSDSGEEWRLLTHRLGGGSIVLGILDAENLANADARLNASVGKFGSSVEEALRVPAREIDTYVQTAIISDTGELLSAWGGVPIKADPISETDCAPLFETRISLNGKYRVFRFPILSTSSRPVGRVFLHKEITGQDAVLRQHRFVSAALAILAIAGGLIIVFWWRRPVRRRRLSVQEAISPDAGESDTVEFKSSFQYDMIKKAQATLLRKEVIDTVAAFLNSRRGGGQLFIGVTDDSTVCGIDGDLRLEGGSRDKFELLLRSTLTEKIGRSFAPLWQVSFEAVGDKLVAVIDVEPSHEPAFVKGDKGTEFFIRTGNRNQLQDSRDTHTYLEKNRRWFS